MPVDPDLLDPDPMTQLASWIEEARAVDPQPDAFALATADAAATPSVRMVLLRGIGPDGLRFYTNRRSRKGRDMLENPRAAAVFHWAALGRQARVAGTVAWLNDDESAAYWATRPRGSQLSARISRQGSEIASRRALEERARAETLRWPEHAPIPLPAHWGGYLLTPEVFEFWESRPDRLHDRVEYVADGSGGWRRRRLQP